MATSLENVFRFVAVRPPEPSSEPAINMLALHTEGEDLSAFHASLAAALEKDSRKQTLVDVSAAFRESKSYVTDLRDLDFDILPIAEWVATNTDKPSAALRKEIAERNLDSAVNGTEFRHSLARLADTLLCDAVDPSGAKHAKNRIADAYKIMRLIEIAADDSEPFDHKQSVGELIHALRIRLPDIARAPVPPLQAEDDTAGNGDQKQKIAPKDAETDRQKEYLHKLAIARRQFERIVADPDYGRSPTESDCQRKVQSLERKVQEMALALERSTQDASQLEQILTQPRGAKAAPEDRTDYLSREQVEKLKQETRDVIGFLDLDPDRISPRRALHLIEHEMDYASSRLAFDYTLHTKLALHGLTLDLEKFKESVSAEQTESGDPTTITAIDGAYGAGAWAPFARPRCNFQAGVADLLIVQQKLTAYEVADFAHVENVLVGEMKFREHRRLDVREEYVELETEEEYEKERDLQTTERSEMQVEAEEVIQSQFELSAGTQISGSYGGVVTVSAGFDIGYGTATEESKSKAQSYAREVTQRTSERIMERVREERRTRVLEEIEETNQHQINNDTGRHVRGIYRWLNKIYEAQILNYGQRMMFDFTIPEPAAYFLYAMVENPPEDFVVTEPEPPSLLGRPLRPEDIHPTYDVGCRYAGELIGQYRVSNAPVLSPSTLTVTHFAEDAGAASTEAHHITKAGTIEIPKDYEAVEALVSCATDAEWIGGDIGYEPIGYKRARRVFPIEHRYWGDVAFDLRVWGKCLALSIHILCERTVAAFKQWQQDMYDAVMDAYDQQKAAYEDKMAALAIQEGIPVLGRNPLENRQIERDELKKLVITMLINTPTFEIDSLLSSVGEDAEPLIDIMKACENSATIRFFEQAFEWNNMLYVFYPYFWGRRARWRDALHITDPDTDFAAFLKAGAARVQLPVRPGFESAVAYYCQTGEVWEGDDVPLVDDDRYVPIVDEIVSKMGSFDEGVPYPNPEDPHPWEVTVPTSLIVVQDLDEIPDIRDILTDEPISILDDA